MAKMTKKANAKSTEFHGRGPGPKGQPSPSIAGSHKKGDSRSRTTMKAITPQKGC